MQVYRGLDQITNKHPIEEREGIPHHLLGHVGWDEDYSVQRFEREALAKIEDIQNRGKLPILVGGTHYYNQAVMFKNATLSTTAPLRDNESEEKLSPEQVEMLDSPASELMKELKKVDPAVAEKFHPNDTRRLRRALEVYYLTNKKTSDLYAEQRSDDSETSSLALRFRTLVFWVWCEQEVLNPRLDARVDVMLQQGLYKEVQELYEDYQKHLELSEEEQDQVRRKGVHQVIGFKEFLPRLPLKGTVNPKNDELLSECIDKMKQVTRKYSKQQTKFMKNTLMPKLNTMVEKDASRTDIAAAVLDATNLSNWNERVAENGIGIAKKFLDGNKDQPHFIAETPELRGLMGFEKKFTDSQWKHYVCDVCKDNKTGMPIVAVGENLWNVHLNSRRHRGAVEKRKKMDHIEAMKEKRRRKEAAEEPRMYLDTTRMKDL